MAISSKEIILILLGLIGSALIASYLRLEQGLNINTLQPKDILIILGLAIIFIIIVFHKRIRETEEELEQQKKEQERLNEKLKIYKRLSKIEEKIGI